MSAVYIQVHFSLDFIMEANMVPNNGHLSTEAEESSQQNMWPNF